MRKFGKQNGTPAAAMGEDKLQKVTADLLSGDWIRLTWQTAGVRGVYDDYRFAKFLIRYSIKGSDEGAGLIGGNTDGGLDAGGTAYRRRHS